jgi:hypothetical protein
MGSFKADLASDMADVFFNTDDFADVATYNPASGASYSVNGIFDAAYKSVDPNSGATVSTEQPIFTMAAADVRSGRPIQGDTITIAEIEYKIRDPQPDGKGLITLFLTEIDDA